MQPSSQNSNSLSQVTRLPKEQQQNPMEVFNCFFNGYTLVSAKQNLANCIETALSTENYHFYTAVDRANLICYYHFLEDLLEAAFIIREMAAKNVT